MTQRTILITGGAGFIGSHVVRLFVNKYPEYKIINLDKLTYAGNLANLKDIEDKPNYKFVKMDICDFEGVYQLMQDEQVDGIIHLAAESHVDRSIKDPFTFARTNVMGTLSLLQAAKLYWESQPEPYKIAVSSQPSAVSVEVEVEVKSQCQSQCQCQSQESESESYPKSVDCCPLSVDQNTVDCLFYHISTDEVYGALEMNHPEGIPAPHQTIASAHSSQLTAQGSIAYGSDFFYETTKYNPHSPYSASKASSDHFVRAYHDTYGMPTIVTNCSNNYGPYQFPEKLIPLFINNIRNRKPLPVYGKGENVRDWLYVEDHARAIDLIFHKGKIAETYNIGGFNEWKNIDLIKVIIKTVDKALGRAVSCQPSAVSVEVEVKSQCQSQCQSQESESYPKSVDCCPLSVDQYPDMDLITFVTDRLGHDARYAIDSTKLQQELGWEPSLQFEEGIEKTVRWYLDNQDWMDNVTSGDYQKYYEEMYHAN